MINLAGDQKCDEKILEELKEAGINIVRHDEPFNAEVAASITGQLGRFSFTRAWYYWVVDGNIPLRIAQKLYKSKVGKEDVRVAGHCGCPPPEDWVDYIDDDGFRLANSAELDHYPKGSRVRELVGETNTLRWVECPSAEGKPFITTYHIDSQEGLNLFAKTIREYKLL